MNVFTFSLKKINVYHVNEQIVKVYKIQKKRGVQIEKHTKGRIIAI